MEAAPMEKRQDEKEDPLRRFDDREREVIQSQLRMPVVNVGYRTLYRYASGTDILVMSFCSFCATVAGAVLPLMTIVFGHFAGQFTSFLSGTITPSNFNYELHKFTLYYVYLGIGSFVSVFITMAGFSYTGERMTQKIREAYLRAILRQNVAFFDNVGAGEVATRITADMNLIQDGLSQKVGLTLTGVATFFAAIIVGFVRSWRLTLVMLSVTVAIILVMGGLGPTMKKFQTKALDASAVGGTWAEEAISSIRTATAFGTQEKLATQYDVQLKKTSKLDFKGKAALAILVALMMAIINLQYGLAFWQGSRFLKNGDVTVSEILTVIFASMLAGVSLGNVAPHAGAFGMAVAAAKKVFHTIVRESPVDPEIQSGQIPNLIEGEITFRDVRHVYPSRPEQTILENFNLTIPSSKVTAIVGASGSGKSTVVGLIERFYLPVNGELFLDGYNIQDLNLQWLRRQISLVSQEPVLFSTTIYSNIEFGLIGTEYEGANQEVKTKLIEDAAKIANAHEFISRLPDGLQTRVGDRGSRLSGGQKQRIAIARAIVSNPKILLLDEATASLDTKSENIVQDALETASKGRTTLVIAHRLSTIQHADNIVVMAAGKIVEQGTHSQLLDRKGAYFTLVQSQQIRLDAKMDCEDLPDGSDEEEALHGERQKKALFRSDSTASTMDDRLAESGLEKKQEVSYSTRQLIQFIWSMNQKEKGVMIFGFLASLVTGSSYSVTAILFGNAIASLSNSNVTTGAHDTNFWAGMFLMLGVVLLIFYLLQGTAFGFASSRLIRRARAVAFRSILRQDIAFFEEDQNSSGTLASFLSIETNQLAGISGATLGAIINFTITVIGATAVACSFGWKLALVFVSTMPILLSCGFLRFWVLSRLEKRTKRHTEAAAFACEAASAIRTVASLTLEQDIWQRYHQKLDAQAVEDLRHILLSSTLYAMSQSFNLFATGLAFWYGGTLIVRHEYTVQQFFVCFVAVIWGSQSAAAIFSYAPDMGNAKQAAKHLKVLLDRTPPIDSWSTKGSLIPKAGLQGTIEFRNVHFAYPLRPEQSVLKGINLIAKPGQFVALVGASGSGKSTAIALLERFYDPQSGGVLVDGQDISTYNLQDYRSHLALVSQETTLYMGTIRDNVLADKTDVNEEAIVRACKDANIYEFIMSLPDGFNTYVGTKGCLLSGGQKQRIAIAKALLRDPKILLLDEATSSLDSASESAVQLALDRAANGRTTIAIAHRLSTIQHADMIYVFDAGRVVESGSHDELMGKRGRYWELVRLQELGGATEARKGE